MELGHSCPAEEWSLQFGQECPNSVNLPLIGHSLASERRVLYFSLNFGHFELTKNNS